MPFVYKYTDKNDGICKYVGIIKTENNFPRRFTQHKADAWAQEGDWEIKYIRVNSVCDAEMLEGHLIAEYQTYNWYNKAKDKWGRCSYAPDERELEWEVLTSDKSKCTGHDWAMLELVTVRHRIYDVEQSISTLYEYVRDIQRTFRKSRKDSINVWARNRLERACNSMINCTFCSDAANCSIKTSSKDCFEDYKDYLAEDYNLTMFEFLDLYDFWAAANDSMLERYIYGDNIRLILKNNTED